MLQRTTPHETARDETMDALAVAIARFAHADGDYNTAVSSLTLHRRRMPTEPLHCIYNVGVGLVAQGAKQVMVGTDAIDYGPGQSMLTTIDLPVISRVTRASASKPFLGMMLTLEPKSIVEAASAMEWPPRREAYRSISIEPLDPALLDALLRLVKLLDEPAVLPRLAPLIQQEVIVRLLNGPHGAHLHHHVTAGSPSQQIAKAVAWLKQNFVEPLNGDALADRAHMSPSTFRLHFRALTGLSPLQYQKQLRLQEARMLMLTQHLDAGTAAGNVGYESASQFSREYSRLFGAPPQRDVGRLRNASTGGTARSATPKQG
jgi:AraC-like DNA-binding protein